MNGLKASETDETTGKRAWPAKVRRAAIPFAIVAAGLLVLAAVSAAGVFAWLQSDGGRRWLADSVATRASTTSIRVTIGALEGRVPTAMTFSDITIADHKGPWLTIHHANLTLDFAALLGGRLDVIDLTVDRLDMPRPPLPDSEPAATTDAPPLAAPLIGGRGLPLPGAVRRLVVEEVALGTAVLGGAPAVIHAEGAVRLGDATGPLRADVTLSRRDGQPGGGHLGVSYTPENDRLNLDFAFSEPAGGVLARALRLRDLPALTLTAAGDAPLSGWHGLLTAQASGRSIFQIEASISRVTKGHLVVLTGGGDPTPLLTPSWAGVIGSAPRLTLKLLADSEGGLTLQPGSSVALAGGDLITDGSLEADTGRLALRFGIAPQAPPLVRIGLLPTGCGWRSAALDGTVEGSLAAPILTATLKVANLKTTTLTARGLNAQLRSAPGSGGGTTGPRTLVLDATVDYLTGAGAMTTGLTGPHPHLQIEAIARPGLDELTLQRIALTIAAGTITGSGTLAPRTGRVQAHGHFTVNHLTRLLGPLGVPLSGVADLDFIADAGRDGGKFDITGTVGALATENSALDHGLRVLLDDGLRVKGSISLDQTNGVHARDWRFDGPKLNASVQADIVNHRLEAKAKIQIPHLTDLAEPLGLVTLEGAATLEGRLRGMIDGLAATTAGDTKATLVISDLIANGRPLGRATLDLTADGLPSRPRAALTLRATPPNTEPVAATATIILSPDGKTVSVIDFTANQKENSVTGTARANLDASDLSAHLTGQWPKLESLAPLLGETMLGRGRFDLVLGRRGDHMAIQAAFGANGVRWTPSGGGPALSFGELEAKGSFSATTPADILNGRVTGTLRVTGQSLKADTLEAATLTASAEGAPDRASFQLSAAGSSALEVGGTWSRGTDSLEIRLARGGGKLGATPLALAQPANLTIASDHIALTGLRLTGNGFFATAEAQAGTSGLKGHLQVRQVPLELLKALNPMVNSGPMVPNSGRLDGEVLLSGSLADPRADTTLHFTDVGQAQAKAAGLALGGLDGSLTAHWFTGRLNVEGDAKAGKTGAVLRFGGNLPLRLRFKPLALDIDGSGAIHGNITGSADLAALNDVLAATGDRLAGKATVDVTIDGTPAAPQLGGRLAVNDGRYENQALGAVIDHITARLTGTGQTFTIEQFSGRAANGGAIAGSGVLRLGMIGDEALDVHVTARNARLLQIDAASADVDADMTVTGGFRDARLAGNIQILHADIRLPDRLPPEIVDLKVIDARPNASASNSTAGTSTTPQPQPQRKPVPPGTILGILAPPEARAPAAQPIGPPAITLALSVTAANQVLVHGRGLDSEFSCALKINGDVRAPTVRGTLTMLRGKFDILGKEFQFKHGTIEFAEDTPDPVLDMLAEAKATGITAQVQLGGRAHAPRLTLSSVPALPQDEVLARVLFDKPVAQVTALEAVQLADSASQLAGFGGSAGLVDRVRRTLGIDRLNVTTTTNTTTGTRRSALEAGRYVGGDVYVGVQQGLAADSSRAKVEVGITNTLQAEVDVGVHADPQVGLKFEWDY